MHNVTYYPFLQFFPENFELTEFQFPVATGLIIWIKENNTLCTGANSSWIYYFFKHITLHCLVPLNLMQDLSRGAAQAVTVMAVAEILREHNVIEKHSWTMQAQQNKKDRLFWGKNSFECKCDLDDSENEITWLKQIATVVEAVSQPMCYSVLLSRDDALLQWLHQRLNESCETRLVKSGLK